MTESFSQPSQLQMSLFNEQPIFRKISEHPKSHLFEDCLLSLQRLNLTRKALSYQCEEFDLHADRMRGLLCSRSKPKKPHELVAIKNNYLKSNPLQVAPEAVWRESRSPGSIMLNLDVTRLPADAMAFYRPFHFEPFEEWGIYLYIEKLVSYCEMLYSAVSKRSEIFTLDTLLSYVLFEIFHHEFFHHIVECAATTLEILSPSLGSSQPLYINYRLHKYESERMVGIHEHKPLEEALANAYAYNSLSFISRVEAGYKMELVKHYQKFLEQYWHTEPPGYRNAGCYTYANYMEGAGHLMSMLLASSNIDAASALLIGRSVMLNGNSAYFTKPDIPTYLVGSEEAIRAFTSLIPAPHETYTHLFWPGNSAAIDTYIDQQKKAERAFKQAAQNK